LLHCAAEAALGGHDLGEWQQIEGLGRVGYLARCKRCKKTAYTSRLAVYGLLADVCPGIGDLAAGPSLAWGSGSRGARSIGFNKNDPRCYGIEAIGPFVYCCVQSLV